MSNPAKPNELTRDDVVKVARLAMLDLTEEELGTYTPQLASILALADKLESFELDGLTPTAHPHGLTNVFREDIVEVTDITEVALTNAPETENHQFKVPPALGEEL